MEFAQALILTNALGSLSSLGRSSEPGIISNQHASTQLGIFDIELCYCDGIVQIYLVDRGYTRDGLATGAPYRGLLISGLEHMLPGRLIVRSGKGTQAFPLYCADDHLAARLPSFDPASSAALELSLNGEVQRSPFIASFMGPPDDFWYPVR